MARASMRFGSDEYSNASILRPGWLIQPVDLFIVLVFDQHGRDHCDGVQWLNKNAGRLTGVRWFLPYIRLVPNLVIKPVRGKENQYCQDALAVFGNRLMRQS